ncbi:MAG: DEAD/DEAH box helicase family protein [Bacillota bacterium]
MSLKDLAIKDIYWSGEDNLLKDFYIPCLKESIIYDRAVGFFNSSILKYISDGLYQFIINEGKIRLITNVHLTETDKEKIKKGYSTRDIIEKNINKEVDELLKDKEKANVQNLAWLIKNERLNIRICLRDNNSLFKDDAIYHEKFGIFKDQEDNILTFMGSINESMYGWMYNEESFQVSYSWENAFGNRVSSMLNRFERLWNGNAKKIKTYNFPEALKNKIIKHSPPEPVNKIESNKYLINNADPKVKEKKFDFKPRKCQKNAYLEFKKHNKILFQMSTGSGKTLASLYSINKKNDWKFLLILVPTKELVEQWEEDIKLFFENAFLIKAMSDYSNWKSDLMDVIEAKIPFKTIVISTYASASSHFSMDKWKQINNEQFALIADEAHNLGGNKTKKLLQLNPKYRIGLSATPQRNFDEEGTEEIISFFDDNNYTYTIKEAIQDGYLVEYYYDVYPVFLTELEWDKYKKLTKEIKKINFLKDKEDNGKYNTLQHKYLKRSKILKTADNKLNNFFKIIKDIPKGNRILIYADSKDHLSEYANELEKLNRDYFIYTGDKDTTSERPAILKQFKLGSRKILLAINCLDEGIDIPVCDSAIFISSSTSKRQFIQRRGRVLRKSPGKKRAYLYDYLVVPPVDYLNNQDIEIAKQIIKKEYERINIIADDAINGVETQNKLDDYLEKLGLGLLQF